MGTGPLEHDIQSAFFDWVDMMAKNDPRYLNFAAAANAGKRSMGALNYYKKEGLRKGYPDVLFMWPSKNHHGLFLEFKRPGEKLRRDQREWFERLTRAGYLCAVVFSVPGAMSIVKKHLTGAPTWEEVATGTISCSLMTP